MSMVAQAFVAIQASTQALATGLSQAYNMTVSGVSSISKAVGGIVNSVMSQLSTVAQKVAGEFKKIGIAILGIAATADTSGVRINALLRGSGESAGFTRKQLDMMAASMASIGGVSQRTAREAQVVALSFGAIRGDVFSKMMQSLPDLAAALGTSLPAAAKEFGSALSTPQSGLDLLAKIGETITPRMRHIFDAAIAGSDDAWHTAQQLILEKVKAAATGANAEFQTTLAGAFGRLKATIMDLAVAIEPVLIPAINGMIGAMQMLQAGFASNRPFFEAFGKGIADAFWYVGQAINFVIDIVAQLPPGFVQVVTAVAALATVATFLSGAFTVVGAVLAAIFSPIGILIAGVIALGYAINMATGGMVWSAIKTAASAVFDWFDLVTSNLGLAFEMAWTAIKLGFSATWDFLVDSFWVLVGVAWGATKAISAAFSTVWHNIKALFTGEKMKDILTESGAAFSEGFNSMTKNAGETDNTRELRDKLKDQNDKLNKSWEDRKAERKKREDDAKKAPGSTTDMQPMSGTPSPMPNMAAGKFETIGLTGLWMKVQESMIGQGSIQALTQQQVNITRRMEKDQKDQTDVMKKINENLKGPAKPAVAG